MDGMVRTLLVWCPDWPVVAAEIVDGVPAHAPVAVMRANRVVACSPAARAEGVRRGLRKREAQSRCPRLVVVPDDPGRDARAFEPVVAAVEEVAPGVEVIRPGTCALAARGPARYLGRTGRPGGPGQPDSQPAGAACEPDSRLDGEARAAECIVEHIAQTCGVEAQVGIADGVFAAGLAARTGRLVPPGESRQFLAGIGIEALERPHLTDLLRRLGIRTLGDFAALPRGDVLTRFGFDAALAHRLAAGEDHRPLAVRRPPPDLEVTEDFDDPIERVDVAAFAARALAERLHDMLAGHGLACTRLGIEAVTAHGEELHRTWRHDGLLTAVAIADRVRWQLEGWLTAHRGMRGGGRPGEARPGGSRPTAGIRRLRLVPEGVIAHVGLQPGLWGDAGEGRARADRAFSRVQGMLGPDAVVTAVLGGGRTPATYVRWVPWGDERSPGGARTRASSSRPGDPTRLRNAGEGVPPWPGRLPPPAPATVLPEPLPAAVYDAAGRPVTVSARLAVSAPLASLVIGPAAGDPAAGEAKPAGLVEIIGWGGPWPIDERWWAPG
ncbi:MAG: DNA polymerase Y family protein, partial [Micromonosporaceae bacterium]|nr:DNA polymerase Y family protein [Micromonosporaceae bacterium]